jgi:hypothetical protein
VKGGCGKVHTKVLQNFTQVMEEIAEVTLHGEMRNIYKILVGKPGRDSWVPMSKLKYYV